MQLKTLQPFHPYVPPKNPQYEEMNIHANIKRIIGSERFFPTYVYGGSGIGKTECIRQVCSETERNFLRVQIGPETDRSSLIIKFALIGGDSVFVEGPVLAAARNGAVLMLDELDRGTDELMCLQGILEGNPILIEETGEVVTPAPGFTIIATGNTGGRGDVTGKFIAANELDHAFLERFKVVYHMDPPGEAVELKILKNYMKKYRGKTILTASETEQDESICASLCGWAAKVRNTEKTGDISFSVSTRRLTFIIEQYVICDDIQEALTACLGVYDIETSSTLRQMFTLIDPAAERRKAEARLKKEKTDREFKERAAAAQKAADALAGKTAAMPSPATPSVKGQNQTIVLTGKFKVGDRASTVTPLLNNSNFTVKDSITKSVDLLVCGDKPGASKVNKAKKYAIPIISEDKFFKRFKHDQAGSTLSAVSAAISSSNNIGWSDSKKKTSFGIEW